MPDQESFSFDKLRRKLLNSRFFTISILLHVLLVTILGGTVLFKAYVEPPDFTGGEGGSFVEQSSNVAPPDQVQPQQPTFQVQTPSASTAPSLSAITTIGPSQATFTLPSISTPTISPNATSITQASAPSAPSVGEGMSVETAKGISGFTGGWASGGGSGGPGSSIKSREFAFTAYLAKYAGGDWNSTVYISGGKITQGSLPNLLYTISKWSNDKIKADPQAVPLDLASEEIFSKKPPFILFTGHKDFVLTEKEVSNLRKYVRLGGCIWGDSSLPGENSRFDIAFRREMRRIIPDDDKDFEELPADHPIFTKNYYPEITSPPPGVNYYSQKVMALKIYGEIAVVYTLNDYGDMWQIGINEAGGIDSSRDKNNRYVAINEKLWDARQTYIRNIDDAKALVATYKFGTNMIIHLITRWEDKLRFVPKGL